MNKKIFNYVDFCVALSNTYVFDVRFRYYHCNDPTRSACHLRYYLKNDFDKLHNNLSIIKFEGNNEKYQLTEYAPFIIPVATQYVLLSKIELYKLIKAKVRTR